MCICRWDPLLGESRCPTPQDSSAMSFTGTLRPTAAQVRHLVAICRYYKNKNTDWNPFYCILIDIMLSFIIWRGGGGIGKYESALSWQRVFVVEVNIFALSAEITNLQHICHCQCQLSALQFSLTFGTKGGMWRGTGWDVTDNVLYKTNH